MAPNRIVSGLSVLLALILLGSCGAVTVRHVPEPPPLTSSQVPELVRAGATVRPGAAKVMTASVANAQLSALPVVGGATSTIAIAANTTNGTSRVSEDSGSSLAPLRAINAATSDAVRLMRADPEISMFLRR